MDTQQNTALTRALAELPGPLPARGVVHIVIPHTDRFTVVGNHLAQHPGLSCTAIGIAVRIQSLPQGAKVGVKALAAHCPEGEKRIAAALRELEAVGYLHRLRDRLPNGRIITRTVFCNQPTALTRHPHRAAAHRQPVAPDPAPVPAPGPPRTQTQAPTPTPTPTLIPAQAQAPGPIPAQTQTLPPASIPAQAQVRSPTPPPAPTTTRAPSPEPGLPAPALSPALAVPPPSVPTAPPPLGPAAPAPAPSVPVPHPTARKPPPPPLPHPREHTPELDRAATALLSDLRRNAPDLTLSEDAIRQLTPGVAAWLERDTHPDTIRHTLTTDLPHPLRHPAKLLKHRLTHLLPPPLPHAHDLTAPTRPRTAVTPFQTCDGCDRAFRSPTPGHCRDCRETRTAYVQAAA
ncbi:hypothetical protein ACH4A3_27450 [Streptomyces sp. NPDC018007]|uniref:hypothetical protein n=1 Tax=Streptomyces sp. NPDC018007 TaxID=3365029 RepID=UPI0037967633